MNISDTGVSMDTVYSRLRYNTILEPLDDDSFQKLSQRLQRWTFSKGQLFANVTGFTTMSEKLDAEEVSTVLNDCFKGLISIVYKYKGVIDKFIGDEIMVIFVAPLTHKNDPERAIRCSQEIFSFISHFNSLSTVTLPQPFGIHIGINSGIVVAGNVEMIHSLNRKATWQTY